MSTELLPLNTGAGAGGVVWDDDDEEEDAADVLPAVIAQRRRLAAAAAVILGNGGQGPQGPKMNLNDPFNWNAHISRMTEQSFKLRYRVTFDGFNELLQLIRGDLQVNEKMAARNKFGEIIRPEQGWQLLCVILLEAVLWTWRSFTIW